MIERWEGECWSVGQGVLEGGDSGWGGSGGAGPLIFVPGRL